MTTETGVGEIRMKRIHKVRAVAQKAEAERHKEEAAWHKINDLRGQILYCWATCMGGARGRSKKERRIWGEKKVG